MTTATIKTRRAFRRTDDYTPGTPKLKYVEEALPPLGLTSVLIKIHAISLNYRDTNIANGGNLWPVLPNGILCNDAAGEVVATGEKVKNLAVGDKVAPIIDTNYITGRELGRSWLAADEDGVMADHIIFDEEVVVKLPDYLDSLSTQLVTKDGRDQTPTETANVEQSHNSPQVLGAWITDGGQKARLRHQATQNPLVVSKKQVGATCANRYGHLQCSAL